jgi:hypothetical protein
VTPPSPQRGQIWADNDPRSAGRTLRVDRIENGKAVCTILTNSDKAQRDIDAKRGKPSYYQDFKDMRGKTTKISLARFKPVSTGYRLIRDEQYGIRWGSDSPVFAFGSRAIAEQALADDGRGIGVLVVHEYEPHTPNSTEWREVEDR